MVWLARKGTGVRLISNAFSLVIAMAVLLTACSAAPPGIVAPAVSMDLDHAATCESLARVYDESPPVDRLEAGNVTPPDVDGAGPLRALIVAADPTSPRPAEGIAEAPFLEPDYERDVVVMVGSVDLAIDDLAERLVAADPDAGHAGYTQVNGQTLERTVTIKDGKDSTDLTLFACDEARWMVTRAAIDPATTGECAKAGRVAACREALVLVGDLSTAVPLAGKSLVRPEVDRRGLVIVDVRFELMDGTRHGLASLFHHSVTAQGWQRVDPPPCPGGLDLEDLCDVPEDEKELRHPDGLRYIRDGTSQRWTATWRLARGGASMSLNLRQLP